MNQGRMNWPIVGQHRIDRPPDYSMRVPDQFLKCVAFIAEVVHEDSTGQTLDHQATGFIATVPSAVRGTSYPFFITARHSAKALVDRNIRIVINNRNGGVSSLEVMGGSWYPHPDESVDAVAIPCILSSSLDVVSVNTGSFLTKDLIREKKIGVGDEVFTVGLFSPAIGEKRNTPIVRYGNIAMIPEEPIQVESRFSEVYLIEARSLGGLSGSPVFVRQTLAIDFGNDDHEKQRSLCGSSSQCLLLGLVHGHWDVREADLNEPSFIHDRQRGVNLGVAVVVPSHKILEVLNQPSLVALREEFDSKLRRDCALGPDTV
jgi:hypothetical protein